MNLFSYLICATSYSRAAIILFVLFVSFYDKVQGQNNSVKQLNEKLEKLKQINDYTKDTTYLNTLNQLAKYYESISPDSAISILAEYNFKNRKSRYDSYEYEAHKILGSAYLIKGNLENALVNYQKALLIAEKLKNRKNIISLKHNIGLVYLNQGNYPSALEYFYESRKEGEFLDDYKIIKSSINNIAIIHFYQGKFDEAERAYIEVLNRAITHKDTSDIMLALNNLGEVNVEKKNFKKALSFLEDAFRLSKLKNVPELEALITNSLGAAHFALDSISKSKIYYTQSLDLSKKMGYNKEGCRSLIGLTKIYTREKNYNIALKNGLEALDMAQEMGQVQLLRDASEILAQIYEAKGDGINALKYYKQYHTYVDSLVNIENERAAANFKADLEITRKKIVFERKSVRLRWIIFSSIAALMSTIVIIWIINRNRKKSVRANKELQHKNAIIEDQKKEVEIALSNLKLTQNQLIHAEKMASLGELTAGIAHEIQNPLNFVNNFSEVSIELLNEMKDELGSGNTEVAKELAEDVILNLSKIKNHGMRADSIVKGMLQHSRSDAGERALTNINQLTDEFVRLSYLGLKAKDKNFNATIHNDFDTSIGMINVVAQDVGRVILNILTNAFYEVNERKKQATDDYIPTVSVSTKKLGDFIEIRIGDNGNGIPEAISDKIFQPFFTTKPSGEGTGLGLSLSYDIITKGHGGDLKVESEVGKGSTFIIVLPI